MNIIGQRQALVWMAAAQGPLWMLTFDVDLDDCTTPYTEGPEEQALRDDEPQNYLVRVFTTKQDAINYKEAVAAVYPKLTLFVEEFPTIETLWPVLLETNDTYMKSFDIPIRVVLSEMPSDTWPKSIDTVFDVNRLQN